MAQAQRSRRLTISKIGAQLDAIRKDLLELHGRYRETQQLLGTLNEGVQRLLASTGNHLGAIEKRSQIVEEMLREEVAHLARQVHSYNDLMKLHEYRLPDIIANAIMTALREHK